jgi:ABC-2 type transport system ATP-binding protein
MANANPDDTIASPAIKVSGLVFEYTGVRALDDVSFTLPQGTITALVGPNGAGKTTLLRCLVGLEQPLSGHIEVAGVDVLKEPRICHRHTGYLSDSFGLYDSLTVQQCLHYAAAANGVAAKAIPPAIEITAEKLGLADRLYQPAGQLSRGLRQRVAIGQAIIHKPSVILLDEPAAGLDPEARHSLSSLFRLLCREGMTLLVSSHILAELAEYCTDMLVLKSGKVAAHEHVEGASDPTVPPLLELTLVEPITDLAQLLASFPTISSISAYKLKARFHFSGDMAARYQLLQTLLAMDIPVCGFTEIHQDMQTTYLNSIKATPGKAYEP